MEEGRKVERNGMRRSGSREGREETQIVWMVTRWE
jgi:hypothetical protein